MPPSTALSPTAYDQLIDLALREDLGAVDVEADLTAAWTVASDAEARARIIARQAGVVAGIEVARAVFARLDQDIAACAEVADGDEIAEGQTLVRLQGRAQFALGWGAHGAQFPATAFGCGHFDSPLCGGSKRHGYAHYRHSQNHAGLAALTEVGRALGRGRQSPHGALYDAVLIKENHAAAAGGVRAAIRAARGQAAPIYVEAENLAEVEEALAGGPDRILLDNMDAPTLTPGRSTHPRRRSRH